MKTPTQSSSGSAAARLTSAAAADEGRIYLLQRPGPRGAAAGEPPWRKPLPDATGRHIEDALRDRPHLSERQRSIVDELCSAIRSTLDDAGADAERSLLRAAEMLRGNPAADSAAGKSGRAKLCLWQLRKVAGYVDSNLSQSIRNEDLAALLRLNTAHFARAFRASVGEPPHEYVIRRRMEHARALMLSTCASLSEIALDCGLADQSHLTRLFRRHFGESPAAWRRARLDERMNREGDGAVQRAASAIADCR